MRICLSRRTATTEGWRNIVVGTSSLAHAEAAIGDLVDVRRHDIDEVLIVDCLEHLDREQALGLLMLLSNRLVDGASVTLIVPNAEGALAAFDAGELDPDELTDWVEECFGDDLGAWCGSDAALAELLVEAGLGLGDVIALPADLPPGLTEWRTARRAVVGAPVTGEPPAPPIGLSARVRKTFDALTASPAEAPTGAGVSSQDGTSRMRELLERLLPMGRRRRAVAVAGRDTAREAIAFIDRVREIASQSSLHEPRTPGYRHWARQQRPSASDLKNQRQLAATAVDPITLHCVVLPGGSLAATRRTIGSLHRQAWSEWRVILFEHHLLAARGDRRVAAATADLVTEVSRLVSGGSARDLVVFLEPGDVLAADALFRIVDAATTDPLVDLVYWDDDVLDGDRPEDPVFKPAWSPEMLLGANYIGRSFAMRVRRLAEISGIGELGDDTWWDMLLRADLPEERVARIPRVLVHLVRRFPACGPHGVEVVSEHLRRHALPASAEAAADVVHLAWSLDAWPSVTIIVPSRHNQPMLRRCLGGVAATDYDALDVIVVDNGGKTEERVRWYEETFPDLDLHVEWWDEPFNYSAVNNHAARRAKGEVLVFLNDDTELPDTGWLRELVGWATRPEIGVAGLQLVDGDGRIQHGGVVLGLNGFADHLFEGLEPGTDTLLGSTRWYRNVLAVTAACLAIRAATFEELGGFDERFRLCGSDVVLGLDSVLAGKRNVCSAFGGVRHLVSSTRGDHVPREDYFASFWRYQRWVFAGDPYFSPNLSLGSCVPALRARFERTPADRLAEPLGRTITVFRQSTDDSEVEKLAQGCRITDADVAAVRSLHASNRDPFEPKTINWFLPELDSPFYGGINTALRMADHLARVHGVDNRFVIWAHPNDAFHRSAIAAAFPGLAGAPIFYDLSLRAEAGIPAADLSIATLWVTAYSVARATDTRRKFYLIQDFEPMFYPAGTMYALAEESYRMGLYGICNTENLLKLYSSYGGEGLSFSPAVDRSVFHANRRPERRSDDPVTVFVYARPGHWRNCWELAALALQDLKRRLGDRVRIVTAGSWARPEDVGTGIHHLGLLDYRETGNLYRSCDVGVALTVSEHPSYLPLELLACGVPVVAFDNAAGYWLLRDGENCLLARRTVEDLTRQLERLVLDADLRRVLAERGLRDIDEGYASWDKAFSGIYEFLSDPEGVGAGSSLGMTTSTDT